VEGAVQQTGEAWMIAGQPFAVDQGTSITGDPQAGDIVRVEGYSSVDGTPLAEAITLLHPYPLNRFTLTGEVQVIDEAAWEIAGQTVTISATTWIEPGIDIGDSVRAEGVIGADGGLQATQIILFSPEEGYPFDMTGVVQSIENGLWRVSGLSISVDGDTSIAPDLGVGDIVQVSGRVLPNGTWLARRILPAAPQFHTFELIGRLESLDPWRVAGITLQTREWTEVQAGLAAGDLVQVRGFIQEDGAWVAYQILRVEESPNPLIVIIGRVISVDPWVVSGIPLNVTTETIIEGEITPGILVRVEAYLLPDGTWQVVRISAIDVFIGIPGCMVLNATVVGVEGDILRLLGWPKLEMDEDIRVEGDLRPNSIVLVQLCFDEDGRLIIVLISLAYDPDDEDGDEPPEMDDKVTLCHKPYKKQGGHSITVSRSALPAHLGHGDYIGGCSK
jgi:hypothetical protein